MPRRKTPPLSLVKSGEPEMVEPPHVPIFAPSHLSDEEASYFREFCSMVPPQIRLTPADIPQIARWATYQALMIAAKRDIEENGSTVMTDRGQSRNKSLLTIREAADAQRRIESVYGMTADARARLGIARPVDEKAEAEEFFDYLCQTQGTKFGDVRPHVRDMGHKKG